MACDEDEIDEVRSLLRRHRTTIIKELSDTNLVAILVKNNVLNISDEDELNALSESSGKCDFLINFIAKNGFGKFKQFCYAIENECPKLLSDLIDDKLKCDPDKTLENGSAIITNRGHQIYHMSFLLYSVFGVSTCILFALISMPVFGANKMENFNLQLISPCLRSWIKPEINRTSELQTIEEKTKLTAVES